MYKNKTLGTYVNDKRVYHNYDFESEYNKNINSLNDLEIELLLKNGKVKCLYKTKTITSKNAETNQALREIQIYPVFYKAKDVPKKKINKENQRKRNDKNARRKLTRLIIINFKDNDLWCTFGWNNKNLPKTREEAQKQVSNFIKKINRRQKKAGKENVKYIYVLAFDGYARPHFHIVISNPAISRDELEQLWDKGERKNTRRIKVDNEGLLTGLANYIAQNPHGFKKWVSSINLKKPTETNSFKKFTKRKVEKNIRDYELLKNTIEESNPEYKLLDADIRYNGINNAFYVYARMVRN